MTDQNPLVSIIIPTYNRVNLIGETLDSVLAQTYKNWECIVVDDGSTDATGELMAEYLAKDARFQYHHRPDDRLPGGNAARNYGFEVSKGDYITFLDSDDIFHKEALSIKMEAIKIYKSDVIISRHTTDLLDLSVDERNSPVVMKDTIFDVGFILSRNRIITSDPIIKAEFFKTVQFDEKLKRFQDHEFFIRFFRQKMNLCFIEDKLYYHRPNEKSISAKTIKGDKSMINDQIAIHKEMNSFYSDEPLVIYEYRRKAIKMYKALVENGFWLRILEHFHFFKDRFSLSLVEFSSYFLINVFFGVGYDRMKKKALKNDRYRNKV